MTGAGDPCPLCGRTHFPWCSADARVEPNGANHVDVSLLIRGDGGLQLLKLSGPNARQWVESTPETGSTVTLSREHAQALHRALIRFYLADSAGKPAVMLPEPPPVITREDLLHERERVDKLLDYVIGFLGWDDAHRAVFHQPPPPLGQRPAEFREDRRP